MLRRETDRLVDIAHGEEIEYSSESNVRVISLVNEFAESEVIQANDLVQADNLIEVKDRVFSLLSGKIESLRNTGTEEEFAEFERRLTLAAIDELWMNHIDSMAHLREEVAFEGYAQKNPLIIYKERAYDKFVLLIDTISVRVIK
jgi:preprotein translocase subunit SecA